jgi:hypothetical protein
MDRFEKDQTLLRHLLAGDNVTVAAEKAQLSRRTAHRRLNSEAFQARLRQLREKQVDESFAELSEAAPAAVRTVVALLNDNHAAIRLQAAKFVLENCADVRRRSSTVKEDPATESANTINWAAIITELAATGFGERVPAFSPLFAEFESLVVRAAEDPRCASALRSIEIKILRIAREAPEFYEAYSRTLHPPPVGEAVASNGGSSATEPATLPFPLSPSVEGDSNGVS